MIRVLNKPTSLNLGGAETTLMNYYRNIDRSKVQFDFLLIYHNPDDETAYYKDEMLSLGAQVFFQPLRIKSFFKDFLSLKKLLKNNPEIKIIHIHGSKAKLCAKPALYAMLSGLPVRIVHSRNALPKASLSHKLYQPILRFLTTHRLACSTEAGQSLFGKRHFKGKKAILFPNARNLEPFRFSQERRKSTRDALGIDGQKILLNIARLIEQKNLAFLLDVLALVLKNDPNIILLFAGDNQGAEPSLKEKASALGIIDNVRFLGMRNDIPELLQAADLFLLPSIHEGLPGAAIEAQAAGLPCILSDTITKEAKVTNLVEFLPIDKGPYVWAKRIIESKAFVRQDTLEDVRRAGYDIKDAAKKLEEFYLSLA